MARMETEGEWVEKMGEENVGPAWFGGTQTGISKEGWFVLKNENVSLNWDHNREQTSEA